MIPININVKVSKGVGASFVDRFCLLSFMLVCVVMSCLFLAALEMADLSAVVCVVFSCVVSFAQMFSGPNQKRVETGLNHTVKYFY